MTDLFPAAPPPESNPLEIEGELTPARLGPDGKPRPVYWMPTLAPLAKRDMGRALREYEAKKAKRKAGPGYKSARQLAEEADGITKTEEEEL